MSGDHKGVGVLELPQVGQSTCPRPEFGTTEILIRDQGLQQVKVARWECTEKMCLDDFTEVEYFTETIYFEWDN